MPQRTITSILVFRNLDCLIAMTGSFSCADVGLNENNPFRSRAADPTVSGEENRSQVEDIENQHFTWQQNEYAEVF